MHHNDLLDSAKTVCCEKSDSQKLNAKISSTNQIVSQNLLEV